MEGTCRKTTGKTKNSKIRTGLTCIYVNARSLVNKIDSLRSEMMDIDRYWEFLRIG